MSAVNKANPLRINVLAAQQKFVGPLAVALVTLLAIHAAPKDIGYWMRRNMTLAYFAAALLLLFQLTAPLKRYLILLESWRFTGAPEPLSRAARSHALSLAQLVSAPACLGLAFIGSIAGLVLSRWFPALETLNGPMSAVWWISLIALGLFPIAGGFLFNEAFQKHRLLSQEVELNRGFAPRPLSELVSGADDESVEALVRVDAQHFKAGGEVWSWDDFFKSCVVFGETGSGKTSCVLNSLLDGLLGTSTAGGMPPAALVLDPKAGYLDDVRELCRRHGRSSDLIVIDPLDFSAQRWNPLDSSDDSMELASRFAAVSRALGAKDASTTFWQTKSTMVIQNAIDLLRLTSRPDQPPSFARIHELVADPAYLEELLSHALALGRRETECVKFFSNEWRHMAPDQRSGVEGHLTNLLNPFLQAPYRTTIAGVSQVRVGTAIDAGKILYLKLSCADRGQMARVVGMFLKLEYYREVLKRPRKQRPSLFFCDEFQKYHTPGQQDG
ncbi:MAG TPA: type IV secretory system conjugative DNA transfer family protein, partial [Pirellulaceae bacterium]|nr:type IV secretory system conjugative DNA transfer family protein [Pirellulaceae bacterium]